MDIYDALASVLGEDLAAAIIRNQGLEWAVEAAKAKLSADEDPKAVAAIMVWSARAPAPDRPVF